ncbi:unnamed protein product [Clonostachys solani]|uniref:Ubiquitin-like protease family profile domain-containing protein n=1 Tax=Clonostachys solani TaxID=160281 RepID=A0A9P0EI31_9HYPO|nr:unnamed protein product [Clonostachys solani]
MSFSQHRRELHVHLANTTPAYPKPARIANVRPRLRPRRRGRSSSNIQERISRDQKIRTEYLTRFGRRGVQSAAVAARGAVRRESQPSVEFVTSPPRIRQGRPNQPFIVDDIYPSEELNKLDYLSRLELKEASGPYPNSHWRLKNRPHAILDDSQHNNELAIPHEPVRRKRRASSNELDLAAGTLHAIFSGSPLDINHQAARLEDDVPGLEDDVPDVDMHTEPTGLVQSVFSMFSSVAHALTGFGQTITRYISNPSQEVVETRQERPDGNVVNKRRKLNQPKEYEGEVQWASDEKLEGLEAYCTRLQSTLSYFSRMKIDSKPGLRSKVNDQLRPIGTLLAGSIGNPTPIMCGKTLPRSHCDLYTLFLDQLFELLPRVYDWRKISELKAFHGPTLHPRLDLGFSPLDLDALFHIKSVFSFQSIFYILADLTTNYEYLPRTTVDKTTMRFIDRLLLDIDAIFEGLIPPSYLDSPDYLKEMMTRFPAPVRGPLVQEMPGTFPNELPRSTPRPTSAPSEVPHSPEPVQEPPPKPIADNAGAPTQVAISRATDTSKGEPGRTLRISKKGLRFPDVRPASSILRDSPSPPSSPIFWRSYYQPLPVSPHPAASKKEPFAGIEQKTFRNLDALFSDSGPISLQLSDLASSALAQKREEEARIAAEAAEAAERAAAEKARIELEARLALTGGLRVPRQKFVPSLSGVWNRKVRETLTSAPTTSLTTTVEGIDLRRHDFAKVVPETEWLNDEIVNGSLMWLDQAINSAAGIKDVKKQTRKCLTMSSFFFKQLREKGIGRTQRTLRRYGVEKRNFLDIDTILMPICERSHWTLLVVRPSRRTVSHMDSMRPVGSPLNTNLALAWIKNVLEDAFVAEEWTVVKHEAPRQTNGWDCGVHTITNAMCVALGLNPIDSYSTEDMPLQRLRIASVLLNRGFSGDFDLGVF